MDKKRRIMPAGAFKQGCLAVLDEVAATSIEILITKRNKPVARLVPVAEPAVREQAILARLRGRGKVLVTEEELLRPIHDAGWPDLAIED